MRNLFLFILLILFTNCENAKIDVTRYNCTAIGCVADDDGEFASKDDCLEVCNNGDGDGEMGWDCDGNGDCYSDSDGEYSSYSNCIKDCDYYSYDGWDCDGDGDCYSDSDGEYSSYSSCMKDCDYYGDYDGEGCEDCVDSGGFYCGDNSSNWTIYSPNGCVPSYYIGDGYDDCEDGSDEETGATTDCD